MLREAPYKSVSRAFEVLELVGAAFDGLGLKELAERLGTGKTGDLHAMLKSLVEKGYLIKLAHPIRYVIGPALDMVDRSRMLRPLHQRLAPVMSSVCRQIGMTVTYQQLVAGRGLVLFYVDPKTYFHVDMADYTNSPYGTSVIFQAYMTPDEQDRFWAANPMDEQSLKIWGGYENLRRYLKLAARQRLVVIGAKHGKPFRATGPIFDSSGKVFAAISALQSDDGELSTQQANEAAQLIHRTAIELSASAPLRTRTKTSA